MASQSNLSVTLPPSRTKTLSRYLLGVFYIVAGINHFINPAFYLAMMPSYLPWHSELVFLSGVAEAALGALVLVPRWSTWAAWGLIALLVAVFPANLNMALNPELYPSFSPALLWLRLPFQPLFIAWAWWHTRN